MGNIAEALKQAKEGAELARQGLANSKEMLAILADIRDILTRMENAAVGL